jgi:hypothetical protein
MLSLASEDFRAEKDETGRESARLPDIKTG